MAPDSPPSKFRWGFIHGIRKPPSPQKDSQKPLTRTHCHGVYSAPFLGPWNILCPQVNLTEAGKQSSISASLFLAPCEVCALSVYFVAYWIYFRLVNLPKMSCSMNPNGWLPSKWLVGMNPHLNDVPTKGSPMYFASFPLRPTPNGHRAANKTMSHACTTRGL